MLIPIARIKDDIIHVKEVREFKRTNYFYINSSGEASVMYRTIDQAKEHIQALFSDFEGFELIDANFRRLENDYTSIGKTR